MERKRSKELWDTSLLFTQRYRGGTCDCCEPRTSVVFSIRVVVVVLLVSLHVSLVVLSSWRHLLLYPFLISALGMQKRFNAYPSFVQQVMESFLPPHYLEMVEKENKSKNRHPQVRIVQGVRTVIKV